MSNEIALIVGAGSGLSAAVARAFTRAGMKCVLAARSTEKLKALCEETGASAVACDASQPEQVEALYAEVDKLCAAPSAVVFNASGRVRGPLVELDPAQVANAIAISAYGGFLVGQDRVERALTRALENGRLAHGLLFAGPAGVGRELAARLGDLYRRHLNDHIFVRGDRELDYGAVARVIDVARRLRGPAGVHLDLLLPHPLKSPSLSPNDRDGDAI